MTNSLSSRGPDNQNFWIDNKSGIALGHTRLSIQDLSEAGNQPMISNNNRFVIVFNGEIYNHLELRRDLNKEIRINWKSTSDTETLLESFCFLGVDETLKKVNGMFAFALFDRDEKTLILGRDRIGEKPIYYGKSNQTFFFGSELKSFSHILTGLHN